MFAVVLNFKLIPRYFQLFFQYQFASQQSASTDRCEYKSSLNNDRVCMPVKKQI